MFKSIRFNGLIEYVIEYEAYSALNGTPSIFEDVASLFNTYLLFCLLGLFLFILETVC